MKPFRRTYFNKLRPFLDNNLRSKLLVKTIEEHASICYYCNSPTFKGIPPIRKVAANQSTIDHVYHSYDIRRHTSEGNRKVVLSCSKCNRKLADAVNYYMSDDYYNLLYPPQSLFMLLNLFPCKN